MFQTSFSDQVRNTLHCATMAVGNIYETDHVNSILAAGRADLVALARPHLADPNWPLRAAAELGYRGAGIPNQYGAGIAQLARNLERAAELGDLKVCANLKGGAPSLPAVGQASVWPSPSAWPQAGRTSS